MSYKKKHKQQDDEWRKKNFKGANIGPGGYQAHYVNNVINKYEKIAGKTGGRQRHLLLLRRLPLSRCTI